jgi:hypothetical protein
MHYAAPGTAALKVLEWAGVLTWQHRIARIQVRERDLFGRWASRWRVTHGIKMIPPTGYRRRSTRTAHWSVPCSIWAA